MRSLHTDIGLGAIASLIVLGGDTAWLIHDTIANGLSLYYGILFLVFLVGYVLLTKSWIKHHQELKKLEELAANHYYDDGRNGD